MKIALALTVAFVLLIAIGAIGLSMYCFHFNPYVEIAFTNQSKQTIQKIVLRQGTNNVSITGLQPDKTEIVRYTNSSAGLHDCFISIIMSDGHVFNQTYGSGGFGNGEEFTLYIDSDHRSLIQRRALP